MENPGGKRVFWGNLASICRNACVQPKRATTWRGGGGGGRLAYNQALSLKVRWALGGWQPRFNTPGSRNQEGQQYPREYLWPFSGQWAPLVLSVMHVWNNTIFCTKQLIKVHFQKTLMMFKGIKNMSWIKYKILQNNRDNVRTFWSLILHLVVTCCNYTNLLLQRFTMRGETTWKLSYNYIGLMLSSGKHAAQIMFLITETDEQNGRKQNIQGNISHRRTKCVCVCVLQVYM